MSSKSSRNSGASEAAPGTEKRDFIRTRIRQDIDAGALDGGVITRFPPEPNGYLHIGHAKSICLNFGVAEEFGGHTYLRFDDTNPLKEDEAFVEAIQEDVRWLGFDWGTRLTYASDYFGQLYEFALELIRNGKAYVCSLSGEEIRMQRGTLTEPGVESPYRNRSVAENLDLFARMRAGEFADGEHVLRAKIDMASPNVNMRDPVLYRIRHAVHQRTGDTWVIYPMYDYTHCICDALEGITHSLCTLEFEDHRPLYDWVIDNVSLNHHPPQIEFSRLGLEYAVMSKRFLAALVAQELVDGWDDPRMPTIAGLRRRGVRPQALRDFCDRIGVTKQDNRVEMELLEFCIRQDLEQHAPRGMCVLDPLRVVITNHDETVETLEGPWHAQQPEMGVRTLPFGRELAIERSDFADDPPKGFKRLSPGGLVRLRYAYILRCDEVVRDAAGEVVELHCSYVPESRSGSDTSGLKPAGVIHWVHAPSAVAVEVREYGRLFTVPAPDPADLMASFNTESRTIRRALVEPAVMGSDAMNFQFERNGYYVKDLRESAVFQHTVSLRDSYKPGSG